MLVKKLRQHRQQTQLLSIIAAKSSLLCSTQRQCLLPRVLSDYDNE